MTASETPEPGYMIKCYALESLQLSNWFEPNKKHWHGETATTAMNHTAIQENLDGKVVEWMELVTDEQYAR